MATEVTIPRLGWNMDEGTFIGWLKSDGQHVTAGEPLFILEGDKAAQEFHYEGFDLVTLQKIIERDYTIPAPQTAEEVIGYYARRIAQEVKLPSQFAALVPKVREFLETRAFGGPVKLNAPEMVKAISSNVAQYVTLKTFVQALRQVLVEELQPQLMSVDELGKFLRDDLVATVELGKQAHIVPTD